MIDNEQNLSIYSTTIKEHHGETRQDLLFLMEMSDLDDCVSDI